MSDVKSTSTSVLGSMRTIMIIQVMTTTDSKSKTKPMRTSIEAVGENMTSIAHRASERQAESAASTADDLDQPIAKMNRRQPSMDKTSIQKRKSVDARKTSTVIGQRIETGIERRTKIASGRRSVHRDVTAQHPLIPSIAPATVEIKTRRRSGSESSEIRIESRVARQQPR
jgi:hypothetical protein